MSRLRVAFVSPLPPVRSGIADYAADLLPHLRQDLDLELFVRDDHPDAGAGTRDGLPIHPASRFEALAGRFDAVVYQSGNNEHHDFVLDLARRHPGILVLHDLVLHHLYEFLAAVRGRTGLYEEALRESYGTVGERLLRWKRWGMRSDYENFVFPLFESLAARSLGVLVHGEQVRREVERCVPGVPVRRVPMGIPADAPVDRAEARRRLGIADSETLVGAFGFLTPIKRLDVLVRAAREARRRRPEIRLVLVGEPAPAFEVEEIVEPGELRAGHVQATGYVSRERYRDWMAAADIAVNLRYPTAGETSASCLRLLAAGKCTVVTAAGQFLEIPSEAVVRIPLGAREHPELVERLVALASDAEERLRIGDRAREHVAARHSMEAAARANVAAIREIASRPAPASVRIVSRLRATSRTGGVRGSVPAGATDVVASPGKAAAVELVVRNDGVSEWISTAAGGAGEVTVTAEILRGDAVAARVRPATLARDVAAGEEETVVLSFIAPRDPGEYRLRPALAHFGRLEPLALERPLRLRVERSPRSP